MAVGVRWWGRRVSDVKGRLRRRWGVCAGKEGISPNTGGWGGGNRGYRIIGTGVVGSGGPAGNVVRLLPLDSARVCGPANFITSC